MPQERIPAKTFGRQCHHSDLLRKHSSLRGSPHAPPRPCPMQGRIRCSMPIVPASEGAWKICKRRREERCMKREQIISISRARYTQTNHQTIIAPSVRRHRVSAPRRDAARDTIIRPIAIRILRGSIARMEDKIFTRARQHRYKNIIESRGDSTILFY